jgi:hypothetical protein
METQPLGLAYVASVFEKDGYTVDMIDSLALELRDEELKKLVNVKQPDLVGITALTPTIRAVYCIAKLVREVSNAFYLHWGPHVSFLPEQSLQECKSLDAVELPLCEVIWKLLSMKELSERDICTARKLVHLLEEKKFVGLIRPILTLKDIETRDRDKALQAKCKLYEMEDIHSWIEYIKHLKQIDSEG